MTITMLCLQSNNGLCKEIDNTKGKRTMFGMLEFKDSLKVKRIITKNAI